MANTRRSIISALEWAANNLKAAKKASPRLDAELILANLLGIERIQLYLNFEKTISDDEAREYVSRVKRRESGEPVAYITGAREFFSMVFSIKPGILIPRPETECMVESALAFLKGIEKPEVLDICTGCGNIAIAIASEIGSAKVIGIDISTEAVELAAANAIKNSVDDRTTFLNGDICFPVQGMRFDLIIANPPYIPTGMIKTLQPEISLFEPATALDGGADGMDLIKRIIHESPGILKQNGYLLCEMAEWMTADLEQFISRENNWTDFRVGNDLSGRPRFISIRKA